MRAGAAGRAQPGPDRPDPRPARRAEPGGDADLLVRNTERGPAAPLLASRGRGGDGYRRPSGTGLVASVRRPVLRLVAAPHGGGVRGPVRVGRAGPSAASTGLRTSGTSPTRGGGPEPPRGRGAGRGAAADRA